MDNWKRFFLKGQVLSLNAFKIYCLGAVLGRTLRFGLVVAAREFSWLGEQQQEPLEGGHTGVSARALW